MLREMNWLVFFLSAFAVWRVANIIAEEKGPFAVFEIIRQKIPAKSTAGEGIRCPFCVGVHLSILTTAWLWWIGSVPAEMCVIYVFGCSGAAAALKRAFG